MVEAKQEGNIRCPQGKAADFNEILSNNLPVILSEGHNPLESTYYVGKQTLKDNYFGQEPIVK